MVGALNPNDLLALVVILQFYEQWQREKTAPSAKRSRTLLEVRVLIVKVCQMSPTKEAILTVNDVGYIKAALDLFATQIKQLLPQSRNHDEIMKGCEKLQAYFTETFVPHEGVDNR